MKFTNLRTFGWNQIVMHEADTGSNGGSASDAGANGDQAGDNDTGDTDGDEDDQEGGPDDDNDSDDEDDDLQKRIDAAVSSRANQLSRQHARAISDMEAEHKRELEKIRREKARAGMTDEERENDEVQEKMDELDRREQELAARERNTVAAAQLTAASLPNTEEYVSLVVSTTDEETQANVDLIRNLVTAEAKKIVKDKLKTKNQPGGQRTNTNEKLSIGAQIAKEREEKTKQQEASRGNDPWAID